MAKLHTKSGYDYIFVGQYPNSFKCPICLLVMREPHIVSCCGKKFCKACKDKIPEKKCPICTQPFTSMREKELESQILDLKVKCNTEDCDWVGELRDISSHLEDQCQHFLVECSLGCGLKMKRGDLSDHCQHHCTKRSVEAQLASIVQKLEERVADLQNVCRYQTQKIKELRAELCCNRANITFPHYQVHLSGLNESWFSPPFYTHHSGYKLCLKFVNKLHQKMLSGTYDVLCQLQLISGEHDWTLEWPVDIRCVVEIMYNQFQDRALCIEFKITGADKPNQGKSTESEAQLVIAQVRSHLKNVINNFWTLFSANVAVVSVVTKPSMDTIH